MIYGLIIGSVTLTKRLVYIKTSFTTVIQPLVTHIGHGNPILAISCFSRPNLVTGGCLTTLKLFLKFIYL